MKTFRFFAMLMIVVLSTALVSCSDDDDAPENPAEFTLANTSWTYTDHFVFDGVDYVETYNLSFSDSKVVYVLSVTITDGSQVTTQTDRVYYDYVYSKGLVVFKPITAGNAYLEGDVMSDTKMIVTNTSTNKEIGTFYKD